MDFEEFCAAALSVYQLEALDRWEQHARCAYELFEKDGNRTIMIEELASVMAFLLGVLFIYFFPKNCGTKLASKQRSSGQGNINLTLH